MVKKYILLKTYLAPYQHRPEDHLQPVEEVVSDDDDRRPTRRPPLAGADGFYTGGCHGQRRVQSWKLSCTSYDVL